MRDINLDDFIGDGCDFSSHRNHTRKNRIEYSKRCKRRKFKTDQTKSKSAKREAKRLRFNSFNKNWDREFTNAKQYYLYPLSRKTKKRYPWPKKKRYVILVSRRNPLKIPIKNFKNAKFVSATPLSKIRDKISSNIDYGDKWEETHIKPNVKVKKPRRNIVPSKPRKSFKKSVRNPPVRRNHYNPRSTRNENIIQDSPIDDGDNSLIENSDENENTHNWVDIVREALSQKYKTKESTIKKQYVVEEYEIDVEPNTDDCQDDYRIPLVLMEEDSYDENPKNEEYDCWDDVDNWDDTDFKIDTVQDLKDEFNYEINESNDMNFDVNAFRHPSIIAY